MRQIALSGSLMAARRIGKTIHTVVADGDDNLPDYATWPSDLAICGVKEATVDAVAPTTATVQSRPDAVFASENALYLAVTHQHNAQNRGWYRFYSQHDEVSDIHKFRLGARPELTDLGLN